MNNDDEMVLWGTIHGWSKKLAIAEDVLRERCKGLPTQPCRVKDPNDPTSEIVTVAYAEPGVLEACADLWRPQMVDTEGLLGNDIRKQIKEEAEGP
jgi:hypothetical protein